MIITESLMSMLNFLEEKCQLTTAELASACKVSKQSIYRAKKGNRVSARVRLRIMIIYLAAKS